MLDLLYPHFLIERAIVSLKTLPWFAVRHSKTTTRLKGLLQAALNRAGIYERAKASWFYDCYRTLTDKQIIEDRHKEIHFYRDLLQGFREGDLIFDVGANVGYKTDVFLRIGATVVAVDPDDLSQRILKQKFLDYRLKRKPLAFIAAALGEEKSIQKMWIDKQGSALNTMSHKWAEALRQDRSRFGHPVEFSESKEVEVVTIEELIKLYGEPFFIKVDVEGHELAVLRGMRRPVPYLSFEVNLPEFKEEGLECIQVLARLRPSGKFNYTPDCRNGLALRDWVSTDEISVVLNSCFERSIEIFWKTP